MIREDKLQPFKYHVFACDQQKPEGVPGCNARGSAKTIDALRREIATQGLGEVVQLTTCGSIGLCERGPNLVVYPEGVWYSGVTPNDVPELVQSHFKDGKPFERLANRTEEGVKAEIKQNRDRYLASMRAKDASGALPDDLNVMIRGFQDSRVVLSALELDVFNAIGEGATAVDVAKKIGGDARATETLLNALVALNLLVKKGGSFSNTPTAMRYFTAGSKDDARLALMHLVSLWNRWATLTDAVKQGTAVRYDEHVDRAEEWTKAFIAAMHRNASERAPIVTAASGAAAAKRVIDIGGGSGAYSIAFAKANENLTAEVFDLPNVLPLTSEYIRSAGVESRVTTKPGDLRVDSFGSGFDLALISAVCHMLSPDENRDLLKRVHASLESGGRAVIQEFILDDDKTSPKSAAMFSINMLVGTKAGASYSEAEYTQWLNEAGFADVRRLRLPGPTGLMVGTKR